MANPVAVVAFAHVKSARVAEVRNLLLSFAARAREEQGCVEFHIQRDVADPSVFVFNEVWESMEDVQAHLARPYMTEFMDSRMQYLEEDIDARVLSMESVHPLLADGQ